MQILYAKRMNIKKIFDAISLVIVTFLIISCSRSSEPVDPVNFLSASERAIQNVNGISYDFSFEGTGSMSGSFNGNVTLYKTTDRDYTLTNIEGDISTGTKTDPLDMVIATHGPDIEVINHNSETFLYGNVRAGSGHLLTYGYYAILFQYLQANPFQAAIRDTAGTKWTGTENINGISTQKIKTVNPFAQADITWYLSENDTLPVAQKWVVTTPGVDGEFMFKMYNLEINEPVDTSIFYLTPPEDYSKRNESERNLATGVQAPDWLLNTVDGNTVQLSDQMGNIVVMDFWATWCSPCWAIMPKLDQLYEEFADQPVKFYGINTWESPNIDLNEYLRTKEISYPVLLEGETLGFTYKLSTLPALFVIGKSGEFIYSANPTRQTPEQLFGEVREAIESGLREE